LIAATPVGAVTIICFGDACFSWCRKVVLPVPALPVRKMLWLVVATNSRASCISGFDSDCAMLVHAP